MASTSEETKEDRIRRGLKWMKDDSLDLEDSVSAAGTRKASAMAAEGRRPMVPRIHDDVNRQKTQLEEIIGISKYNPLVPMGMGVTVFALGAGIWNMYKGDSIKQQKYMRLRVGAQAGTVAIMVATVMAVAKFYTPKQDGSAVNWYRQN